jgi:hypothetical protein
LGKENGRSIFSTKTLAEIDSRSKPTNRVAASENRKADLMNDLINYNFDKDDEVLEADDSIQEDRDRDVQLGKQYAREKKYHVALVRTVSAMPLDADLLEPVPVPQQEPIEVRRGNKAEDDDKPEPELPRAVAAKTAKQQVKEKLAAAQAEFGKLPKLPKEAANDNHKHKESWPLIEQLTRSSFEPDMERRAKLIGVVHHIRELIDTVGADSLGLSIHVPGKQSTDYSLQRTESGKVYYEHGQTLDRKKRTYDSKNDEENAERFDGPVRTSKSSELVDNSGFDPFRDDPFPARIIAAHEELDEIIASVGPLWLPLVDVISANATMTNVGEALGAKNTQAPGVGTAIIRLALTAAMEAIDRFNEKSGDTYVQRLQKLPDSTPVPARRLKAALGGNSDGSPSMAPGERKGPKTPANKNEMQAAKAVWPANDNRMQAAKAIAA